MFKLSRLFDMYFQFLILDKTVFIIIVIRVDLGVVLMLISDKIVFIIIVIREDLGVGLYVVLMLF